jgi:predicted acyltransferase
MNRNQSLDALRGFAILTMVLSGSIAFGGVLPAWMYHAQVPPPDHKFIPTIPGITWVDLVFPFFLFSMGAAIPLALAKQERKNASFLKVFWIALRRYLLLTFFALFIYHMRAWVIAETPTAVEYLLSILAFVLLCFQFYEYKGDKHKTVFIIAKLVSFAIAAFLLYYLPFNKGKGFLLDKVDIIILVLGNMAFFGTIICWLTRKNVWLRIGLLAFVMAIFLGGKEKGSWNEVVFNWSPLPWMYKFYYLKYLFIIIPGTIAGEWMKEKSNEPNSAILSRSMLIIISILSFGIIWCNVALLFSRMLILNLVLTVAVCLAVYNLINKYITGNELFKKFWNAGTFLLLLGLFFETYEGGIKKDPSTYSYYFVTSGLAFFMLIGFYALQLSKVNNGLLNYLSLNGRNPMVAYVAGNLLLIPILNLTGGIELFNSMNNNAWIGFLRGVLFTGIVSLITIFFTKRRWFWKT